MPVSVFPTGTTIYKPDQCFNGYSVFSVDGGGKRDIGLVDMNGHVAHRWVPQDTDIVGGLTRHRLLETGEMLVLRGGAQKKGAGVQVYDWDGALTWEYLPPLELFAHHDVVRTDSGSTLIICAEAVPEELRQRASDPRRRDRLFSDVIQEISPDGDVIWEWHMRDSIDIDRCQRTPANQEWWAGPDNNTITDWTHTNTVQALPKNKWFDAGDERFRPGNVLVSLRQLDVLFIVDHATKQIVWEYTGDFRGGMSGQHDSHMIEKGLPGAGNIIIFDNGASPWRDLWHVGASYVLEVDPTTKEVVWFYDEQERFHSNYTSSCQRLPNGNTLILEAAHKRLFEVTPECEIVWELIFDVKRFGGAQRAYRYAYDHCEQMKSLPTPEEIPV